MIIHKDYTIEFDLNRIYGCVFDHGKWIHILPALCLMNGCMLTLIANLLSQLFKQLFMVLAA
ncbi:hypothetical protein D3C71_1767580 [compost metagenome]